MNKFAFVILISASAWPMIGHAENKLVGFFCKGTAWRVYNDSASVLPPKPLPLGGKTILGDKKSHVVIESTNEDAENMSRGRFIAIETFPIDPEGLQWRHGSGQISLNGDIAVKIFVLEAVPTGSVVFNFSLVSIGSDQKVNRVLASSQQTYRPSSTGIEVDLKNLDLVNSEIKRGIQETDDEKEQNKIVELIKAKELPDGIIQGVIIECASTEKAPSSKIPPPESK